MKIHYTNPINPNLRANSDILQLLRKPAGSVKEEDLRNVLSRYNLRNSLITLGIASWYIFSSDDPNNIGFAAHREPNTGIIVTQFALAYLANILLISGANDYKSKYLSEEQNTEKQYNWTALCEVYNNYLVQPEYADKGAMNEDKFRSLMVRMYSEQMPYQFHPISLIGRTIKIFNELLYKIDTKNFENLTKIFEEATGLSIYDYLRLATVVWFISKKAARFNMTMFMPAEEIPKLKDVLNEEKVIRFLNILKADYKTFRKKDGQMNKELDPKLTKTRFNPLFIYPIIETDIKNIDAPYIVPNLSTYVKKAFWGLYWWFHNYFEERGEEQKEFRDYFGSVFQEYVGIILKGIYGDQNVHSEIIYDKDKKFIDWWVERNNKIYLFEAKASQFALKSMQTGDKELVFKGEIKKIAEAFKQVFKRVQDISKYEELSLFRNKKIIPIIVFMDMPFVSTDLYKSFISEALEKFEKEEQVDKLKEFQIYLMNIEDLESFDDAAEKIELEDVFASLKDYPSVDFISVVSKIRNGNLRNRLLDNTFQDFWGIDRPMI